MKNRKWIKLTDRLPERSVDVEYKTKSGERGFAYLHPLCSREWRCAITGLGLIIDVEFWRGI